MQPYAHGGDIYGQEGIRLDFSVNINPLGMPACAERAVVQALPACARYPDPACRALRAALAARHGIEPGMVLCGNGAAALLLALCACLKPRAALTLAPTFSEYERAASLFGAEVRRHPLGEADGFALTPDILGALAPEVEVLFLCQPNNPTGRLADPALVDRIAAACRRNGTLLVLDECFIDFTGGESRLPRLRSEPHVLVLRAFTKIYAMAGLRLGVLYGDEKLLSRIGGFLPAWDVSAVAQAAGAAALREPGWIERTRRLVEEERDFMTRSLRALGLNVYQSDANFLLARSGRPLCAPLRERGILVRDCANFAGLAGRYLRIGLKTREENAALLRAVAEVLHG